MKDRLPMLFADGARHMPEQAAQEPTGGSSVYQEWIRSNPEPGEALVDTGLSSATDCQKLHWSLNPHQQEQFSSLIAEGVERDRKLYESGGLEAEAKRINDLVAPVLKAAGLDPTTFGVSMPEKLASDALPPHLDGIPPDAPA